MGVFVFILLVFVFSFGKAATYYTRGGGGNWSDVNTWSTTACNGVVAGTIPGAGDDVEICQSTVTVDGAYTCNNLTVGSQNAITLLQVTAGNSLIVNGDLKINSGNNNNTYTLDAGPGTITVNGTFSYWGTNGGNYIKVGTGTITFAPFVNLSSNSQYIEYTAAGTINFNGGFTNSRSQTGFITVAGCTAKFGGTYTQTTNAITWNTDAIAIFDCVGCQINNSVRVDLGHTVIEANASVSTAGAGNLNPTGDLTIKTNATFSTTKNLPGNISTIRNINHVTLYSGSTFNLGGTGTYIQVSGNWVNNGGTLNGGTYEVRFEGIGNSIGGTASTTFPTLRFGNTLNNVYYTLSQNITCANLLLDADNSNRTLVHDATNPSLTVTGDAIIQQPTGAFTNTWDIAGGIGTVNGNLIFTGTSNNTSRIAKLNITSGTFNLSGNVTWMTGQATPQEVATEVISVTSGTLNFTNGLSMPQGSGTLQVTGSGTINFNGGGAAPSYNLNATSAGNTINAVFTTAFGSTINFNKGFTNANAAVTLADGSTAVFTGNGTITPTAAITFGNVQINGGITATLAGNISLTNNWTNLGGTFIPGTNGVTFSGTATQTISKVGGETFYNLTTNTTGPLTLANDITVTNTLTMISGNYNLNGNTLTLGNGAASTLSRTAGIMYGGHLRRYWLSGTPVTSANYGLFPVGSSTDYRPVAVNSTANPTSAGYISVRHYDAISVTNLSPIYTDNEGDGIERKHDMYDAISISGGLAGGTYNLDVSFTGLSTVGVLTDMKLITYTGGLPGSVGTSAATTGTASAPTVKRTGLSAANLANDWVVGTKNKSATPLRPPYYSRKDGNWNDATVGNATWSLSPPPVQPSCNCVPTTDALVYVYNTVSVSAPATCDYVIIEDAATLNGSANFTANIDLITVNSGKFAPASGTWGVTRNVTLGSTSASSTSSAAMTIGGDLTIPASASLTLNNNVTVSGNLTLNGTVSAGTRDLILNGSSKTISGSGSFGSTTGVLSITTGAKTISAGSNITVSAGTQTSNALGITGAITVTNSGSVTVSGNITGSVAGSTWTNAAGSVLNITGGMLATGTLNASAAPNSVNYNGSGAQTVKPVTYYNLLISNAGTKTSGGNIVVSNLLTIQNAAILDDNTFSITGLGGLNMSGSSVYVIQNNTNPVPSLSGPYNITGGKINFGRNGNQTVKSLPGPIPSAYYNVEFSWSNVKSLAGPIMVQGNLSILNTARLDVTGANYAIDIKGNWFVPGTNVNPFVERSGTVTFSGTSQQSISTVLASGETFNNLVINNSTPASALLLNSKVNVSNNLTLTDGHILTSSTNILTLTNGTLNGVILGATPQDSSFVKGPMASVISGSNMVQKTFPIGKGNDYRRVDLFIDHQPNSTVTYTAELINSSARALNYTVPPTLRHVSDIRYFEITSSSPTTNLDNAIVDIYFQCTETDDVVEDPNNLNVAQWNGLTGGGAAWIDIGGTPAYSPPTCGINGVSYNGHVSSQNFLINPTEFTGYRFALADDISGANPLPVELLSFEAEKNGNTVDVSWKTASELNSDYFIVQRSKDGSEFEDVEKVEAAGNSTTIRNYFTTDYEPYNGVSYYRLKQADHDGKLTFTDRVAVRFDSEGSIAVYPNPSSGNFNINLNAKAGDEVLVVLRDLLGKEHYSKVLILSADSEVLAVDREGKLAAGVYIVIASSNDTIYEKKIVIK